MPRRFPFPVLPLVLAAGAAATLVIGIAVAARAHEVPARPEVHGHRGARARFPENTLPAFAHAIDAGADVLELDLGVSKDGVLVVSHDPSVNRVICTGPAGAAIPDPAPRLRDLTLAEIKRYDCGSPRNPRFPAQTSVPGTPMPTLDEVFALARSREAAGLGRQLRFNIEAKADLDHPGEPVPAAEFARLIVDSIRRNGMLDRSILQCFDPQVLIEARKLEPALTRSILSDGKFTSLLWLGWRTGARIISPHYQLLTRVPGRAAVLRAAGYRVVPWTANDPETWQALVDRGVDGIITDDPEALGKWLDRRASSAP